MQAPYTFAGSLVVNGATASGARIWIHDISQQQGHSPLWEDNTSVVVNAPDGTYNIDLANCADVNKYTYVNGDTIRLFCQYRGTTQFVEHTVNTSSSSNNRNYNWTFGGGSLYMDGLSNTPAASLASEGLRVGLCKQLKCGFESGTNIGIIGRG